MKNSSIYIIIGIGVLILTIAYFFSPPPQVNWTKSFNERSKEPYGLYVFYKELKNIFPDSEIHTMYNTPDRYFYKFDEEADSLILKKGNYVMIGNSSYLDSFDINGILDFAADGNTVFMSDEEFPKVLMDSLKLELTELKNRDQISSFNFNDSKLQNKNITIDQSPNDFYFSKFPKNSKPLAYVKNDKEYSNFIEIPFETGTIYLHLQPKVFTNYNLLAENRHLYVEGILSYLPLNAIHYDSYYKYNASNYNQTESKSTLDWLLSQPSFRWAWYIMLLLLLLFVIFQAKRKQRVIPIIDRLENTSVLFTKTISNLYFETQDHQNLIEHKIVYVLEKIRTDYHLETKVLDEEFISKLIIKSGKDKNTVRKTITYIQLLQSKNQCSEADLLKLNTYIEEFYAL